jgi:hypothetical protein
MGAMAIVQLQFEVELGRRAFQIFIHRMSVSFSVIKVIITARIEGLGNVMSPDRLSMGSWDMTV